MAKVTLKNVFKIYKGDRGKDVTAVKDVSLKSRTASSSSWSAPRAAENPPPLRMIAGLEEISAAAISPSASASRE